MENKIQNKKYVLSLLMIFAFLFNTNVVAGERERQKAYNFTLKSQHNENIKLSELRGRVVLMSFWASWCGKCMLQFPDLMQLSDKLKSKGLSVLSINIEENNQKAKRWSKKTDANFPILFDQQNELSEHYNIETMPALVVIDRDGNKRDFFNDVSLDEFDKVSFILKGLLNE